MNKCKTCENAIFDALWGDYICRIAQHRVRTPEGYVVSCEHYKEGTPKESKRNANYETNLQDS